MTFKAGDICVLEENSVWYIKGTVVTIYSVSPDDGTVHVALYADARKYWILAARLRLLSRGRSYKLYPMKEVQHATILTDIQF